ncbi:MAG: diguanylate cyclase [Leifsonia sp.]|jgi:diguanylate cyclase (GGDEF)-like protein|nr:diguanylate cyclase [Leifsonia sp.]MDQ1589151.1 hypothetical protein [Microbacteriaceae bacterium]
MTGEDGEYYGLRPNGSEFPIEMDLERLAFRDSLTGLGNRAFFDRELEDALEGPTTGPIHVLLLDLDDYEEVNDILGRQAGDALVIGASRRLLDRVAPNDTVARLGSDEFAVLLTGDMDADDVAARIVRALSAPFRLEGKEFQPSVSLGLATTGDQQLPASDLLRRAGIAIYVAKAAGKSRFVRFRPDMMSELVARNELESGLRYAVERREIVVHYQPIVSVEAGGATQVEALVRWRHAESLIPPLDFIAAAETSGLINAIGREILTLTCAQLHDWLAGDNLRSVAVNISAVQLREPNFARDVLHILASAGVDPSQLILEVTESAFPDPALRVIDQLSQLRSHGIRVSLDDFGTGYSSLGRLQELPVDIIKVDRSFVDGIRTGGETLPILNSVVELAHNLGLHVTAEGVETAAQALHLRRLGCDSMQGFYFGRPAAAEFLADVEWHATDAYQKLTPTPH